jgi:threonine/homoserine/homoserine lactone efflux protein
MELFLPKGIVIGFSIAAPVGPIGLLCISRTLSYGRLSGLLTGLGAAFADGVYGTIAGFGFAFVTDFLVGHQAILRLLGSIFLVGLGAHTFFRRPVVAEHEAGAKRLSGDFASTFLLTLANPFTIVSFIAIFAGMGLSEAPAGYQAATAMVAGVFLGSASWWLMLSFGVSMIRKRMSSEALTTINRLAGIAMAALGLMSLYAWGSGLG